MLFRSGSPVCLALGLSCVLGAAVPAAAQVEALFDVSVPRASPFPADLLTVPDAANLTGRRISLPKPDCGAHPSDCADIEVLNTLDGFNLQTRIKIPFSAAIDPASASSETVFFVDLGDAAPGIAGRSATEKSGGARSGITQVVFDPTRRTLFAESDALLEQHTRYALIATDGLRDTAGAPVQGSALRSFLAATGGAPALAQYRQQLQAALGAAGVPAERVVAASVFTTQSITAVLEKIREHIVAQPPVRASFELGTGGTRTVFPLDSIAGIAFERQIGGTGEPRSTPVSTAALTRGGKLATVAFGSFPAPDFEIRAERRIPMIGTRTGRAMPQSQTTLFFNLFLPLGPRPASGWPVAIFGHGFGGNKNNASSLVASLAGSGIATIAINVVGHGGGEGGRLIVTRSGANPVSLPAGGRGMDLNGDGAIGDSEGVSAPAPFAVIGVRDALRQTVADLMSLVHVIRTGGVDVDGDGRPDLDPDRIFYTGISFGGIYGTMLLAVEGDIRAGVPNVGGGPQVDISRLSPNFRGGLAAGLARRTPPLLNALPATPPLQGFNENLPLRGDPPRTNDVPGAIEIQELFDVQEWVTQSGDPVGFARHVRAQPLAGNTPKPLIFQFARGDQTVPNPTSTAIVRAGGFADRVTLFRNDLFVRGLTSQVADPNLLGGLRNPHGFLARTMGPAAQNALAAQHQIAVFFASNGATIIDPDGDAPIFETPIAPPLPEDTGFLP